MNKMISILISCYKSNLTLPAVVAEIEEVFSNQDEYSHQIILVDDGSGDGTFRLIESIVKEKDNILGISLSKNYGQLAAKMAGIPHAQGDYLVFMDDDGQHPASGIFNLIEEIDKGSDVVYARFNHKSYGVMKRVSSSIHNWLLRYVLGKPENIKLSSFFAISRMMIDSLKAYSSPFPSQIGYMLQITNKFSNVSLDHRGRIAGESNYTILKMIKQWINVVTNFSMIPLRLGFLSGTLLLVLGVLILIGSLIASVNQVGLIVALACISTGLILAYMSILGEYVGRMYMLMNNKPQYYIRKVVGPKA